MTRGIPVNEQRARIPGRFYNAIYLDARAGNSLSSLRFHVFSYTYFFSSCSPPPPCCESIPLLSYRAYTLPSTGLIPVRGGKAR